MDDTHFTAYVTVMQLGQSFFIGAVKPPVALCFGVRFVCPEPVLSKWSVCFIIYRKPQPNQHNTTLLLLQACQANRTKSSKLRSASAARG